MTTLLGDRIASASEKGVRLAQTMQVVPCIPVGIQLEEAEVGPTSGPTWCLSHFGTELVRRPLGHQAGALLEVELKRVELHLELPGPETAVFVG